MALLQGMAHERAFRLQVEDVVLVDRRRHDQQRALVLGVAQRGVLDQLDQRVLVDHAAGSGGQVDPHLEGGAVAVAQFPFVQVAEQMQHAAEQTGAAALDQMLEGFGVAVQVVARRPGGDQLLHQEGQPLTHLARFDRQLVEQAHEKARVEQIEGCQRAEQRLAPGAAGEACVGEGEGLLGHQLHAQLRPFTVVFRLQAVEGGALYLEPGIGVLALEPGVVAHPDAQLLQRRAGDEGQVGREEGREGR
ncbi:hypothetical protein D3C78_1053440 [compost metagenome]